MFSRLHIKIHFLQTQKYYLFLSNTFFKFRYDFYLLTYIKKCDQFTSVRVNCILKLRVYSIDASNRKVKPLIQGCVTSKTLKIIYYNIYIGSFALYLPSSFPCSTNSKLLKCFSSFFIIREWKQDPETLDTFINLKSKIIFLQTDKNKLYQFEK